jgi:predicted ATPase
MMRLVRAHATEFKSVLDSTAFEVSDITCLVGKNEAGKTALLEALYRLNPVISAHGTFDVTEHYPRLAVSDYQDEVQAGRRDPATVVQATFLLEDEDVAAVRDVFGPKCLKTNASITLHKGYGNQRTFSGLHVNEAIVLKFLIDRAELPANVASDLQAKPDPRAMVEALAAAEQTTGVQELRPLLEGVAENGLAHEVYTGILQARVPKFLYFAEYYQMEGHANVQALKQRVAKGTLEDSDHPLLGLIELARLDLEQLANPEKTEALLARLEAAENQLTAKVLKYWSQNRHLRMRFDIRPGQPGDPEGMRSGMNILGRIVDTRHSVSTPLGSRSRGFVWFFSFLAWYSQLKKRAEPMVLLLDEPGLSLHATAQADLLRYFETELQPHHQVLYTTHSPFMVDPARFDRVRLVQDLSIEEDAADLPDDQLGTKVTREVLEATKDTLFPLQGALGYQIHQALFVGPNSLVVEGVSDLLYLQTLSGLLQARGEDGLSPDWTITPVGGSDKVPTFVALLGAQTALNVAVLIDYQKKDRQSIENIYKRQLLERRQVMTYADFLSADEADVEDLFNPGLYLKLVNAEYGSAIAVADLPKGPPRLLVRLDQYLEQHPLPRNAKFNHYRPARYLAENASALESELTEPQLDRFRQIFLRLNKLL